MPTVTITLTDTKDAKSFECECSLDLYPGKPLSLAQIAAADIMKRTNSHWGLRSGKPVPTDLTLASAHPCHQTQVRS